MVPTGKRLAEPEAPGAPRPRRLNGVRALLALVACCGLILWSARVIWENRNPDLTEERAVQAQALQALQSPRAAERLGAIHQLERLRLADGAVALRPLLATLGDENDEVRVASAEALGALGARAVQTGSDDDAVRATVAKLLGLLKAPQPALRREGAKALGAMTFAALKPAVGPRPMGPPSLLKNAPPARPAVLPARFPAPFDTQAVVAALTVTLHDPDPKVRGAALVAVSGASPGDAPPAALAAMLDDESPENRKEAVRVLSSFRLGLSPWLPAFLRVAESDGDRSVREASANVLDVLIGPPQVTTAVIPDLIAALASREPRARGAAAHLLARFGPDAGDALPALLDAFTRPVDVTRFDDERRSSEAVIEALWKVAGGSKEGKTVVATMTEFVRSGTGFKQVQAAWTLGSFGALARPALPALMAMASGQNSEQHPDAAGAAAWALGRLAPETPAADEAIEVLTALLRSERTQLQAIEALRRFGPKAAASLPELRALSRDGHLGVKEAAAKALAEVGGPG